MDAVIISVGAELLTGQTVDTNSAWLSGEFMRLGTRVLRHLTVGDDTEHISGAIRHALSDANLVVITGGLGPTPDDRTRQAIADAIGQSLEVDAGALEQLRAMFKRLQRPLHESNKVQAMIPRGCTFIPNRRGTAPGICYRKEAVQMFALPGVPGEMRTMFQEAVLPNLGSGSSGRCTRFRRLLCFGRSESWLGERLADLMLPNRNPYVGTTASRGIIAIPVVAHGESEEETDRLIEADFSEIRSRLGLAIFGQENDTMQSVVARLLLERGLTISVAESCTGGLLGKRLTDVPGSSAYFLRGYVTYSNEAKSELLQVPPATIEAEGAVSEPVARAMASGCRTASGSDLALSITGIAGPGGGQPPEKPVGLVYLALVSAAGVEVRRILFGEHLSREEIRDRSATSALNLLRVLLLGRDADWAM